MVQENARAEMVRSVNAQATVRGIEPPSEEQIEEMWRQQQEATRGWLEQQRSADRPK